MVGFRYAVREAALVLLHPFISGEPRNANEVGHTSYKILPASLKQAILSLKSGISSSVELRKTCLRTSSVHSSSFCQKSEDVIGISGIKHLDKHLFPKPAGFRELTLIKRSL